MKSTRLTIAPGKMFLAASVLAASALAMDTGSAFAQSSAGPGYFIPHPQQAPRLEPRHARTMPLPQEPLPQGTQGSIAAEQPKMPPIPNLPPLPKAKPPPAAVMGVLAVSEVMQDSTAAQGVEKIIQARRQDLAKQAQEQENTWQNEQKTINGEKSRLSKMKLAGREQALQQDIERQQIIFHNKNIAIQISARTALAKIEATLIAVIRQVSQAHGMNLVLHRSQVALNVNAFDISKEVAAQLNKILPSVAVPPSVVPKAALANANGS